MTKDNDYEVIRGSGNVFTDLGMSRARAHPQFTNV